MVLEVWNIIMQWVYYTGSTFSSFISRPLLVSNQWPPTLKSGAQPTEATRWWVLHDCTISLIQFLSSWCRVLEASLIENKPGMKRKRGDPWMTFVDPVNPHERKRVEGTPVGFKNVGNTCWFSAVIQVRNVTVEMLEQYTISQFLWLNLGLITMKYTL